MNAALPAMLLTLAACGELPAEPIAGANAERGREEIRRQGCVACHTIPGIGGPRANVGPPLEHVARRAYIGGVVPNQPAELIRWLRDPPQVDPGTAMPNMGLSEAQAADIAAYLQTLD